MPKSDQPALDLLIAGLLLAVVVIGALSFFWAPLYEKGAYAVILVLTNAFTGACAAKWGLSQQGGTPQHEDRATTTTVKTQSTTE